MSESLIAKRYARALLKVVGENKMTETAQQVEEIASLFKEVHIGKVLSSPVVPQDLIINVMENVAGQIKAPEDMKKFLKSLVKAGRIKMLPNISRAFQEICDQKQNIVRATMSTAVKIDQQKLESISEVLEKKLNKTIKTTSRIDPKLLGGIVVQIGNTKIDMSLRTKIDLLAQSALS